MMTLQGNSQCFGKIGQFGVLIEMCGLEINRLCVLVCFLKTLEVCVITTMPPMSRFELIGDKYLDVAPKCRKVILRVGWLGFL